MGEFPDFSDNAERRLEGVPAITDEAFAHMDVDEFLNIMLDRVREILRVDTVVVLLVDERGQTLIATAERGITEEVSQAVRVPIGRGFAGRVAAERRPIFIEDVRRADLVNPLLVQRGLRSLLGVPLIAGGTLLGVLHVGTLTRRRFIDSELEFLQLAAARAAVAVQSLMTRAERAAAAELQRSLVPTALPVIPGVELAARYRPGKASVGGDWYDVFTLPTGEVCVVMGDVAGHGLPAAVVMGRMRSALRAYALMSTDPAEVLSRLDQKMQHFEPEAMATVLYAVLDPGLERVRVSSAGHWPPVLSRPGEGSTVVEMKPDILIGLGDDRPRRSTTVPLPPGGLLCFYTDGLVERRDRPIDAGLTRLCSAVYPGSPEVVCASVMAALIGRRSPGDDVALLLLRRPPA